MIVAERLEYMNKWDAKNQSREEKKKKSIGKLCIQGGTVHCNTLWIGQALKWNHVTSGLWKFTVYEILICQKFFCLFVFTYINLYINKHTIFNIALYNLRSLNLA